jgi:hypothetical protein
MSKFATKIRPSVERELDGYRACLATGNPADAFTHLENAHVLGQESTYLHVQAHVHMACWAIRQRNIKEFTGQLIRIVGAAMKTAIGLVPPGNTGGCNVSPFRSMQLSPEHKELILRAKAKP